MLDKFITSISQVVLRSKELMMQKSIFSNKAMDIVGINKQEQVCVLLY
jgi:hypothetical protein